MILRFNPSANGLRKATIEIGSNDPGHPVYRFNVQGTGVAGKVPSPKLVSHVPSPPYRDYGVIKTGTGQSATHGSALWVDALQIKADGTILFSTLRPDQAPTLLRPWAADWPQEYALSMEGIKAGEERVIFTNPHGYGIVRFDHVWNSKQIRWEKIGKTYQQLTPDYQKPIDDETYILHCRVRQILHPEADLRGKGMPIAHGDKTPSLNDGTDFGTLSTRDQLTQYFTLHNVGPQGTKLFLSNGSASVRILGSHSSDFVMGEVTESDDNIITIPVTFKPTAAGLRQATLKIANQDLDESDYTIALCGKGTLPTVTVDGIDSTAAETMLGQTPNIGIIRLSTGDAPTTRPITVNFTTAGPAVRGSLPKGDYLMMVRGTLLPINTRSVIIPAGMSHVDVHVLPVNDGLVESFENVVFNLAGGAGYKLPKSAAQRQAVIVLVDNEPTVTITTLDTDAVELIAGNTPNLGVLRISRSGTTGESLFVDFTVSDTIRSRHKDWNEYILKVGNTELTTKRVMIPADALHVDVIVAPFTDTLYEPAGKLTLTLKSSSNYRLSTQTDLQKATAQLKYHKPTVSIGTSNRYVRESKKDELGWNRATDTYFNIHRSGRYDEPLFVRFALVSTGLGSGKYQAQIGDDYDFIDGQGNYLRPNGTYPYDYYEITMAPGNSVFEFRIKAYIDDIVEPTETITVELQPLDGYNLSDSYSRRVWAWIIDTEV